MVVVVTGASAGVGRATARAFAREGADVALLARDPSRSKAARAELEEQGVRALDLVCDVADARAVEEAAGRVEAELGPIDVWVNNAMTSVFAPFTEIDPDDYRRVTDVTYHSYVYGTLAALRRMKPRDRGTIVHVGSALAYRGIPLQSAYCGAKHAIQGFTDSLRTELLHEGSRVRITTVHLPAVNTPQFEWVKTTLDRHPQPVPPIFQPELAADAIVFAARHPRREYHLGGPTVATIWAGKLVPGLVDRYLARTGVDSQQTDEPIAADRDDNLWEPVEGDWASRGRFGEESKGRSFQWWFTTRRRRLGLGAGLSAFGLWWLRRARH
jgi:NAD(P)-dependent dehydrogenase (short-subunit alcohol dehydrogenase family)